MEDKVLPSHNTASSGVRIMLILVNFNTLGVWVLVCPAIFMNTVEISDHIVIADVAAITSSWQMSCLEFVADVITTSLCCVAD